MKKREFARKVNVLSTTMLPDYIFNSVEFYGKKDMKFHQINFDGMLTDDKGCFVVFWEKK